jgi:hypothetical protein
MGNASISTVLLIQFSRLPRRRHGWYPETWQPPYDPEGPQICSVVNQFSARSCVSDLISDASIASLPAVRKQAARTILVTQKRKQPRESCSSVGIRENMTIASTHGESKHRIVSHSYRTRAIRDDLAGSSVHLNSEGQLLHSCRKWLFLCHMIEILFNAYSFLVAPEQ